MASPATAPRAANSVRADWPAITGVLARAFHDDPVQRWVFEGAPDHGQAVERFLGFFLAPYWVLGHTMVWRDGDAIAAAALWSPPDTHALHDEHIGPLFELLTAEIGDDATFRLTQLARLQDHFPAEPHFYLGILGVDPAHQGRGLGARLLEPTLALADRGGFLCHLESSNPRNVAFYERCGFAATDEFRLGDTPTGPLVTIMQRPPAA